MLDKINSLGIEQIYCCGDIAGYGANPKECIKLVKKLKIRCVKGNHDYGVASRDVGFNVYATDAIRWQAKELNESEKKFLSTLKEKLKVKIDGKNFYFVHGSPLDNLWHYVYENDNLEYLLEKSEADVLVMGHTHMPFVKKIGKSFVINAGSVGQPRDGVNRPPFVIFDTKKDYAEIVRVEYDIKAAADKIVKVGLPEFLAERLFLGV